MKLVPVTSRSWPWMPYAIDIYRSRRRQGEDHEEEEFGFKIARKK